MGKINGLPAGMRLYPAPPWRGLLAIGAAELPVMLIVLLSKWSQASGLLLLCGGVLLLAAAEEGLRWFRCRVFADAQGITVRRWNRSAHYAWCQVIRCEFNFRRPDELILQCGAETRRVPCVLTGRNRAFLRQYASKAVIPP